MKEAFFLQCLAFVIFALGLCQEGSQKFSALQTLPSNPLATGCQHYSLD